MNNKNEIKEAIRNNERIEDKLNVIIVVYNSCLYTSRYILAKEFIMRLELESDINLYIVELAYGDQAYVITSENNKNHLQLRTESPLWHKENLINLGVKYLLPKTWKAFAWIDADIEFDSYHWVSDTLRILNGTAEIVQLFSHCDDLHDNNTINTITCGFCYQYTKNKNIGSNYLYRNPGIAWGITRDAYHKIDGLYEYGILGGGDDLLSLSLINRALNAFQNKSTDRQKDTIINFEEKASKLKVGYVPGVVRHHFHGNKKNRNYNTRYDILMNHEYDPNIHLKHDENGLLIPSDYCSKEFLDDIKGYFISRNEDENLLK